MSPARDVEAVLAFAANPPLGVDPREPGYCYRPCANGLHVCGRHPDEQNFLTVANLPTPTAKDALRLFEVARSECAAQTDDGDLVVDLQQQSDCVEDFWINRQMLDRLVRLWAADGASVDDVATQSDTKAGSGLNPKGGPA